MSLSEFTFTERARPVVEIGIGDEHAFAPTAVWGAAHWDQNDAHWSGIEPTWRDVTCDVIRAECSYGRAMTIERFLAGTANVLVDNTSGWADPTHIEAETPGELTMRPGRQIRVGVVHVTLGTVWLWRGYIDGIVPVYDPIQSDTVELHCIDALGEVNRAKSKPLDPPVGASETGTERFHRLLDNALWPVAKRDAWATGDRMIATDMGGQTADLLGTLADSCGGSVFGDTTNTLCFRPRDWQAYHPDVPADGSIGNGGEYAGNPVVYNTPAPYVLTDGYLNPGVGYLSTPDAPDLTIAGNVRFSAHIRDDSVESTTSRMIAAKQTSSSTALAWRFGHSYVNTLNMTGYPQGTSPPQIIVGAITRAAIGTTPPGVDRYISVDVTGVTPGSQALTCRTQWRTSTDGITWMTIGGLSAAVRADAVSFDSTSPLLVGLFQQGRIYWAQMEQLDAAGNPIGLVWRFDANDYPGTGLSYVDPRGRTWTLSAAGAIVPKVVDPGNGAVVRLNYMWGPEQVIFFTEGSDDVCPVRWERPFERADISTRVIMGRDEKTAVQLDDAEGFRRYGIEPFVRTGLITEADSGLVTLAERTLEVRDESTAPHVRSVTMNAATADDSLDLQTTVDVFRPSRYHCRLIEARGEVFDEEHFATGVRHIIDRFSWETLINLDLAAPYANIGAHWDGARWDHHVWADVALALLDSARQLLADALIGANDG